MLVQITPPRASAGEFFFYAIFTVIVGKDYLLLGNR